MILISNDFCYNIKMYNFDPYNVLLAIATNIPLLLMTALCSRVIFIGQAKEMIISESVLTAGRHTLRHATHI